MERKVKMKKLYRILLLIILISVANANAGVICLNPGIAGFEPAAKRAKSLLTSPTNQFKSAKLYIEKDIDGDFYYHSNYISRDQTNATKIAGFSEINDVDLAMQNIAFPGRKATDIKQVELDEFMQNYKDVEIILDQSVFNSKGETNLKFRDYSNVSYSRRDDPPPAPTLVYNRGNNTKKLLARTEKCCIYSEVATPQKQIMKKLQMKSYKPKETKLMSLIIDSSTEKAIKKSNIKGISVELDNNILSNLEKEMVQMKGQTLVVLGHVERDSYVIRNAMGNEIASVEINKLRELSNKHKVQLIDIGCNTAALPSSQSNSIGVAARFNSLHAVELLIKSHNSSKNYAEFLHNISSKNMPIVIDTKIFDHVDVKVKLFSKRSWSNMVKKPVGTVSLTLGGSITETAMTNYGNQEVVLVNPREQDEKSPLQRALERMVRED